jgi:hypothetical protein
MALVNTIESISTTSTRKHEPVHRCTMTSFRSYDGTQLLQLDTYGTKGRQHSDQPSQKIQLNEHSAGLLLKAIRQAFPALR